MSIYGVAENHYKRVSIFLTSNLAFFEKASIIMKQAKFALTATAVIAVIGGAVAFKSRSTATPIYTKQNNTCTSLQTSYQTGVGAILFSFATKPSAVCTITSVPVLRVE
jgi:hypothetical protein